MKAAAIVQSELIGLKAKVVKSSNPSYVGISGVVVDETRNTLVIRQDNRDRAVVKDQAVFQFTLSDGTVMEVEGGVILGRPEDRVKKQVRRRW
jgi:ribonuclease P protein subunit POP4